MQKHATSDWILVSDEYNMVIMDNLRMLLSLVRQSRRSKHGLFANANTITTHEQVNI